MKIFVFKDKRNFLTFHFTLSVSIFLNKINIDGMKRLVVKEALETDSRDKSLAVDERVVRVKEFTDWLRVTSPITITRNVLSIKIHRS